jgi:branched-chain amino acid transport system permease protein
MSRALQLGFAIAVALAAVALSIWAISENARLFVVTVLNGLTLAALYFLVASGFTLVFGLLRNVNLAHGSLYLVGAYVGWVKRQKSPLPVPPSYLKLHEYFYFYK